MILVKLDDEPDWKGFKRPNRTRPDRCSHGQQVMPCELARVTMPCIDYARLAVLRAVGRLSPRPQPLFEKRECLEPGHVMASLEDLECGPIGEFQFLFLHFFV